MTGIDQRTVNLKTAAAKYLPRLIVLILGILLLIPLALKCYLATSLPAPQLSRLVTSYLQQSFVVEQVRSSGLTLILKGVRLQNQAGFAKGNLAEADSVALRPQWFELLRGRGRWQLIALDGIKVSLEKNGRGVWNYAHLQQALAAKKPSAAETFIKELRVKNGTLLVQGQGTQGVSLQLYNLATKGSRDADLNLAFEDAARNRYALKGKARTGKDAALDLTLTAPSLSLQDTAAMLKMKNPTALAGGKGALLVTASLHKGELAVSGDLSFARLHLPHPAKAEPPAAAAGKGGFNPAGNLVAPRSAPPAKEARPRAEGAALPDTPLAGMLHFTADYNLQSDTARLQQCTLTLNNLATLHAQGSVRGVKAEREFVLQLGMDEIDLALFNNVLSLAADKQVIVSGRLRCDSLLLEGSRSQGLKSATGNLKLRDGALSRGGRIMAAGLSGDIGFSRREGAILASGRLSASGPHEKALLEKLDLPFHLVLNSRLNPVSAEIPSLSAALMGMTVNGRVGFDAAKADPVTASLQLSSARLADLNSLLGRFNLQATSGAASASLEGAGRSAQQFNATATVRLADVRGSRGKDAYALRKGTVTSVLHGKDGRLQAKGKAQLSALAWNGRTGDARFDYRIDDRMLYLEDAQLSADGATLAFSRLSGPLPVKHAAGSLTAIPVVFDLDRCTAKRGELELRELSGRVRGSFNTDSAGSWLSGSADLASGAVLWQSKTVGAPTVHAVFTRSGGRGELGGRLLAGKLTGAVSFNPFAPEAGQSFEAALAGAELAAAAQFLPKSATAHPAGGVVDLRLKGGYSRRDGLAGRLEAKGSAIALAGSGGKMLLSGAGASLIGTLAGGNVSLSEAVLTPGSGVELKLKGEVAQAFSAKRKGSIAFSLPPTAVNGLVAPFLNVLPRLLQEAEVSGKVTADGRIELREGKTLLDGALILNGCNLKVAAQKLVVADISGRLPVSLDLSGKTSAKAAEAMEFSRENYPRLLAQLRKGASATGGQVVTIGKIAFGGVELGKLTMHVSAANGGTQIDSLSSTFYEGDLLGRGFISMQDKLFYRGDLSINGLSLRALCSRFANIKGYISGRVDGVISVSGGGRGIAGLAGFVDLWAREGGGEKMLVSKEFLQRLAKQKLTGFFSSDRPYDQAEIKAILEEGDLSFDTLKILHTNLFGVRDLNVSIAPAQNRISLQHLLDSIKEAVVRGAPTTGAPPAERATGTPAERPAEAPAEAPATEFKWGE